VPHGVSETTIWRKNDVV